MIIYLGADHAGYELKEAIKAYLAEKGYEVEDRGAFWYDGEDDYPDFIRPVAEMVSKDPESRGIVLGGSGQGEAILSNRFPGVRAVVFYGGSEEIVKLSRSHNDANVLSLGARFLTAEDAIKVVQMWLDTPFDGGRHDRRIKKIDES